MSKGKQPIHDELAGYEFMDHRDEPHALPTGGAVGGPKRGCLLRDEREEVVPGDRAVRAGAPCGEAGKFHGLPLS